MNRADVQLGDALIAAERMMQRDRQRREAQIDACAEESESRVVTTITSSAPTPMTLRPITEISEIYGETDSKPAGADKYGLRMWPQYEVTRNRPLVWRRCLELSPQLKARFDATDRHELLKFHDVGLLLDEDMEKLSTQQALILG